MSITINPLTLNPLTLNPYQWYLVLGDGVAAIFYQIVVEQDHWEDEVLDDRVVEMRNLQFKRLVGRPKSFDKQLKCHRVITLQKCG